MQRGARGRLRQKRRLGRTPWSDPSSFRRQSASDIGAMARLRAIRVSRVYAALSSKVPRHLPVRPEASALRLSRDSTVGDARFGIAARMTRPSLMPLSRRRSVTRLSPAFRTHRCRPADTSHAVDALHSPDRPAAAPLELAGVSCGEGSLGHTSPSSARARCRLSRPAPAHGRNETADRRHLPPSDIDCARPLASTPDGCASRGLRFAWGSLSGRLVPLRRPRPRSRRSPCRQRHRTPCPP